jgi:type IV secretory pathway VirB10-like protein
MGWFSKKESGKKESVTIVDPVAETIGSYAAPTVSEPVTKTTTPSAPLSSVPAKNTPVAVVEAAVSVPSQHQQQQQQPQADDKNNNNEVDMAVSRDQHEGEDDDYEEIEAPPSTSYSGAADSDQDGQYNGKGMKQTHLNSLFNGHLMKWKYEAEEGTSFLRVPACKLLCSSVRRGEGRFNELRHTNGSPYFAVS